MPDLRLWTNVCSLSISPIWYSIVPFSFSVPSCTLLLGAFMICQWQETQSEFQNEALVGPLENISHQVFKFYFPHLQKGREFCHSCSSPASSWAKGKKIDHTAWILESELDYFFFLNLSFFIICHVNNNTDWFLFLISDSYLDCIPLTFPQRLYFLNLWWILLPSCWCFSFIGGE